MQNMSKSHCGRRHSNHGPKKINGGSSIRDASDRVLTGRGQICEWFHGNIKTSVKD